MFSKVSLKVPAIHSYESQEVCKIDVRVVEFVTVSYSVKSVKVHWKMCNNSR